MAPSTTGPGRNILFIAYHFPPSAAVGGQRIVNFASGLRLFAWEPQVLTIPDERIETLDRARLKGLETLPIHKAAVLPTLVDLGGWLWARMPGRRPAPAVAAPAQPRQGGTERPRGIPDRVRRFVLSLLVLPDWQRGWCLPATLRAVRMVRQDRIEWIMTSCPPYSVHLIGLAVKLLTGRRWVADFRDPWMTTGHKRLYPTSPVSMRIEAWLERLVVRQADLVVFNVERLRNAYRERYADVPSGKFVYIPNGIPANPGAAPAPKFDAFTICYTGSLYVGRSPEPVLKAMALLIESGRVPAGGLKLKLVGQCGVIDGVPAEAVIRKYGLESVVELLGPVPYSVAFDMVRRSHLALLLAPNLPYQVPAKVYDYLGAGTRILAIAEEGGTADLLEETGSGRAFRAEDVEGIAAFIEAESQSRSAAAPARALDRFDVRRISHDLARHLDAVSSRPAGASE